MSVPLAAWRPSLRVFVRQSALVAVLTVVTFAAAGWAIGVATGYWQVLYAGPVLALAYFILFDDPLKWRVVKQTRWRLTSDMLVHTSPEGEEEIPLVHVRDVRRRLGHSVVVFLDGGLRFRLSYVEDPTAIAAQIRAARDRLLA